MVWVLASKVQSLRRGRLPVLNFPHSGEKCHAELHEASTRDKILNPKPLNPSTNIEALIITYTVVGFLIIIKT